jgi:hypothetical protein
VTHSADPSGRGRTLFQRLFRIAALLLALLVAHVPVMAAQPVRIVAVGDLHGDYDVWLAIARAAGLIDTRNHWRGGNTTLVQLGDIVDREPDSLKIVRNLQQLQREAPRSGGRVVVLLGNHEAMNLLGDLRYTTPGEFAAFADRGSERRRDKVFEGNRAAIEASYRAKTPEMPAAAIRQAWLDATPLGWVEHRLAWGPNGELGRWAASNPAVARIGDTLFVHGGLSAEYAKLGIAEVNRRVAAAMAAADSSPASVLSDPLGPLWYRGLVTRDPKADPDGAAAAAAKPRPPLEDELAAVLAATGARRIVVGHTPILSGIAISHGGRLVRVDTGNSRYYGGQPSYLEIVGDRVIPHAVPRPPQQGGTR